MPPWIWILSAVLLATLALPALARSGGRWSRTLLRPLVRLVYAIRVRGGEHVPAQGGALLVANHASYVDPFLLAACVGRPVRFLMHRSFYERPAIGLFARWVGAIPVASGDSDEEREEALSEASRALRNGDLVAIFAEGGITRTGHLLGFRRGLETIARNAGAPIVPVALDRVWGSIFSYSGGRALWKWPRHLPYRVDVHVARALPPETPAHRVREAVAESLARAARARAQGRPGLDRQVLGSARKHRSESAVETGSGETWSYADLFVLATRLAGGLERAQAGQRVAILAEPGGLRVAAHMACALTGRVAVPLESDTTGPEQRTLLERAGVQDVFVDAEQRVALDQDAETLRLHPLEASGPAQGLLHRVRELLLLRGPWLLALWALPGRRKRSAGLLLLAGREDAQPDEVELGGADLVAAAKSVLQAGELGPGVRVLSTWSESRAAGAASGLWAPLLAGATLVVPRERGLELGRWVRAQALDVLLVRAHELAQWRARLGPDGCPRARFLWVDCERLEPDLEGLDAHACYARRGIPIALGLPDVSRGGAAQSGDGPGACGRTLAGVAALVCDPRDGRPLGLDEVGRVLVLGPGLSEGEDWLDTGDLGSVDRAGLLSIRAPGGRPQHAGGISPRATA